MKLNLDTKGIVFDKVNFSYTKNVSVLENFSLSLPPRTVCLLGESGCGKTTILRLIAGLESPQSGRIYGMEGRRIAYVFQEDRLLPWLTAAENIALILHGKTAREESMEWLGRMGMEHHADKRPAELSGGMKRRVAIARALAAQPELLLLDEPFNGLDNERWRDVAAEITRASKNGRQIIMITHTEEQAEAMGAERIMIRKAEKF